MEDDPDRLREIKSWMPPDVVVSNVTDAGTAIGLIKRNLGGCPRIAIFSQIKAFLKNKHSHIVDITSIIFSK